MKTRFLGYLGILWFLFVFSSRASTSTADLPPNWQSYLKTYASSNSLISAGFMPMKNQVILGEPLPVAFLVRNDGSTNIDYEHAFGQDLRVTITITDTNGQPIKNLARSDRSYISHPGHIYPLKPAQIDVEHINLDDYYLVNQPGVYKLSCHFFDRGGYTFHFNEPHLIVDSSFTLTVLARTP